MKGHFSSMNRELMSNDDFNFDGDTISVIPIKTKNLVNHIHLKGMYPVPKQKLSRLKIMAVICHIILLEKVEDCVVRNNNKPYKINNRERIIT